MKRMFQAFALSVLLMVSIAGCNSGCAVGKGRYDPVTQTYDTNLVADVVVVTAENLRESALNIFDALMEVEREHEVTLKAVNPAIHTFTEDIRKNGPKYLDDVTEAKVAFQRARSADAADRLTQATGTLRSLLASAAKHLAVASKAKKPL